LVKSGPSRRSRRALTLAKSRPRAASSGLHLGSNRDRRDAPGVRLVRPNRGLGPRQADFIFGQIRTDAMLQACAYFGQIGAFCRVARTWSSGTTISDGLGSGAPNAVRAHAVTYPTEGHLEDHAPLRGGWHSFDSVAQACSERKKLWARRLWGNTDLYYMSETGYKGPPR
jgi:hypothetical protein